MGIEYTLISLFLLALGLGLVLTPLVAQFAVKINALDLPGGRKLHSQPVPRLGGIAIYLGFVVSLNVGLLLSDALLGLFENSVRMWLGLIFGGSVVLGLGIVDDIYQIRPRTKLLFQVLAAAIVYVSGLQITKIAIPFNGAIDFAWLSLPVTLLWIVGITNAMNLIDGLDGLASGVALIITVTILCIALFHGKAGIAVVSAILCGSTLGFLRYNFNPARIFMGDSGSMFLGFTLAVISLEGTQKSATAVAILVPILFFGLPIMDTTFALYRRIFQGRQGESLGLRSSRIFQADRKHIHHKLMGLGLSHRSAVLTLYVVTLGLSTFAFLLTVGRSEKVALLLAAAFLFCIGLLFGITVWRNQARRPRDRFDAKPPPVLMQGDSYQSRG